jgi:hypothetical protein
LCDEAGLAEAAEHEVGGSGEDEDDGDLDEDERQGEAQRLVVQLRVHQVVVVARRRQQPEASPSDAVNLLPPPSLLFCPLLPLMLST